MPDYRNGVVEEKEQNPPAPLIINKENVQNQFNIKTNKQQKTRTRNMKDKQTEQRHFFVILRRKKL